MKAIGVLDLQGGVVEHLQHLEHLSVPAVRVKKETDFNNLAGLIIPGGESTCLSRLLRLYGLDKVIQNHYQAGLNLWGTCAGAILLAKTVIGEQAHLALMDIDIERNAFGAQLDSFNCQRLIPTVSPKPIPLTFIRAPKIQRLGNNVQALLQMDGYYAAVEDDQILATVFHPELTSNLSFHQYFCNKCGLQTRQKNSATWRNDSWVQLAPKP